MANVVLWRPRHHPIQRAAGVGVGGKGGCPKVQQAGGHSVNRRKDATRPLEVAGIPHCSDKRVNDTEKGRDNGKRMIEGTVDK